MTFACYCPHVLTCSELGLSCEKYPGTEYWKVTAERHPDEFPKLVVVPWQPPPACRRCDLDRHRCPGCGETVPHGIIACDTCLGPLLPEKKEP